MRKNSRQKGASGERELARELARVLGCRARRGQQYSGSPDSPDVVTDIPGIHIECKRTETLRLYDALAQARRDAGIDDNAESAANELTPSAPGETTTGIIANPGSGSPAAASRTDKVPLVIHRRNRGRWIVILELEDLPALVRRITDFMERKN